MRATRTHILVSETQILTPSASSIDVNQPPYPWDVDWAEEVTFILSVAAVEGAPTAWSLGAKFQFAQAHTNDYRYQNPRWFDLQAENVEACIVEGVGFYGGAHVPPVAGESGPVADQTDTLPITVCRTIVHQPALVRVVLAPSFTGGTTPGLRLSLTATVKG